MAAITRFITAAAVAVVLCTPALAQTPDKDRIKELEQENSELRQELAMMRLELSQLKRELDAAKTDKPVATDGDETGDDGTAPDADNQRDDDKRNAKTFRSADEIFREIPDYLRPAKDGWDKPQTQTVGSWLKDNIIGKHFSARKKLSDVTVKYDSIQRIWNVVLAFEEEKMTYMGWKMQEKIYPITLLGDKEFADAAKKKYKAGRTVQVSGTITRTHWATIIQHKRDENWHPKFFQLSVHAYEPW